MSISSNKNSRVENTIKNTAVGLVMKLITLISNFAVRTVFIHYLGVEYTGVSAVFTDILTVLSFAELGLGSAITFALYKPIADKDYAQIAKLMRLYKNAYRIIAGVVFLVGCSLIPFLEIIIHDAPTINESLTTIYLLYIVNTSVSYLLIYKSTLLTANQQAYIISLVHVGVIVARTIVQLIIIVVFRDFLLYLGLTICFTVIQNIIISKIADKRFYEIRKFRSEKLSFEESKQIFKNIKALSLYKISGTVLKGTDSIIVSSVLGASMVGYSTNYIMIINELYSLALQFLNSVTASIGNLVAMKEKEYQYDMFRMINFVCQGFFCLCTVCLFCLLDEFVGTIWFDKSFVINSWAVAFLCLDFYIKGNTTIIGSFRNANGLFVQGQYRPLLMAVINVVASIIAVKFIGLPGVYLGTVISRVATQLWYDPLIIYKHAFHKNVKEYYVEYLHWFLILVLSVIVAQLVNRNIIISIPVISFVVHACVCVIAVCIMTLVIFGKNRYLHDSISYIVRMGKKLMRRH